LFLKKNFLTFYQHPILIFFGFVELVEDFGGDFDQGYGIVSLEEFELVDYVVVAVDVEEVENVVEVVEGVGDVVVVGESVRAAEEVVVADVAFPNNKERQRLRENFKKRKKKKEKIQK